MTLITLSCDQLGKGSPGTGGSLWQQPSIRPSGEGMDEEAPRA